MRLLYSSRNEKREFVDKPDSNATERSDLSEADISPLNPENGQRQGNESSIPPLWVAPPEARRPFYQRNPLTVTFVLLLTGFYALTTVNHGFQFPDRLWVTLGAFYPPSVQGGQSWRYITATLMHGNPAHWFNNMAGLLIFGNILEPILGSWSLLGLYIVSAVGGLWLSSIFLPQGVTYGASTIDFGLIGAYLTLALLLRLRHDKGAFLKELRGSVMFVLLFVAWNTLESATVNLWGHVGGFIAGVLFMLALWKVRDKSAGLPQG